SSARDKRRATLSLATNAAPPPLPPPPSVVPSPVELLAFPDVAPAPLLLAVVAEPASALAGAASFFAPPEQAVTSTLSGTIQQRTPPGHASHVPATECSVLSLIRQVNAAAIGGMLPPIRPRLGATGSTHRSAWAYSQSRALSIDFSGVRPIAP